MILRKIFLNQELGFSVDGFRLHHQGVPNRISYYSNESPPKSLLDGLQKLGHSYTASTSMSVVQAIYKNEGKIYAVSDPRKYGLPDGY